MINLLDHLKDLKRIEDDFGILFQGQKFDPDPLSRAFGSDDFFTDGLDRFGTLKYQNGNKIFTIKCSGDNIHYLIKSKFNERFIITCKGRCKSFGDLYKIIKDNLSAD